MKIEEIKELAKKSANAQEFEPKRDEWHSHYYGFILGMQQGLEVVKSHSTPAPEDRDKALVCDVCKGVDKIVEEVRNQNKYKERGNPDSYNPYNEGWSDACDILGEKIKQELSLTNVSNNEVVLKAFVEEYVQAFEDGQGSDTALYRQAKSLL